MLKFPPIKTIASTLTLRRSSFILLNPPQTSSRSYATVTAAMGDDSGMDAVQRRLMFDDE
ncbi:putative isopentenyl-diphosphate Delta-isomerase [Helianthus debilis subsp. tardiflorus]